MKKEVDFYYSFLKMAFAMVMKSNSKLRLAFGEKDKSTSLDVEVGYFLKFNGERLGYDIESYSSNPVNGLPGFYLVLNNIKKECPESYNIGIEILRELGCQIYSDKMLDNWNLLMGKAL